MAQTESTGKSSGVTLVEAMLALAILSTGIFVLMETTARCLSVIRVSRNYQTARAVLDMGEQDHPLSWTNEVEDNIVSGQEYPGGFTFSRDLELVDEEEDLYVVRTRVSWSESGRASFEEVFSLLYCPE